MNDERVSKVTIHYLDSPSFTYKGYDLLGVDWKNMEADIMATEGYFKTSVYLTDDTLAVECVDEKGNVSLLPNPKYKASIQTSIMTAKQRARVNNTLQWASEMLARVVNVQRFNNPNEYHESIINNIIHKLEGIE